MYVDIFRCLDYRTYALLEPASFGGVRCFWALTVWVGNIVGAIDYAASLSSHH